MPAGRVHRYQPGAGLIRWLWVAAAVVAGGKTVRRQVVDPQVAYVITNMMHSVATSGTGARSNALGRTLAGKTGTTNDYADAWFVGFSPEVLAGVWVGFDDLRPLGRHETGAKAALPIWINFMGQTLRNYPKESFPIPQGIVFAKIDAKTGLLATPESKQVVFECFKEGTEPKEFSRPVTAPQLEEKLFQDAPEEHSLPPLQ